MVIYDTVISSFQELRYSGRIFAIQLAVIELQCLIQREPASMLDLPQITKNSTALFRMPICSKESMGT